MILDFGGSDLWAFVSAPSTVGRERLPVLCISGGSPAETTEFWISGMKESSPGRPGDFAEPAFLILELALLADGAKLE